MNFTIFWIKQGKVVQSIIWFSLLENRSQKAECMRKAELTPRKKLVAEYKTATRRSRLERGECKQLCLLAFLHFFRTNLFFERLGRCECSTKYIPSKLVFYSELFGRVFQNRLGPREVACDE